MSEVVTTADKWRSIRKDLESQNKTVGFIPTMGALHQGHLSLVQKSREKDDIVVVSIYVNPTQFNDQEDLRSYPTTFKRDKELLEKLHVDYIFLPRYEEIYHDNYQFRITEEGFSNTLCGKSRLGHFNGVLTVVMKLLNLIEPTRAYFGEKDYQQLKLIKGMVDAFFLNVEILSCPTVRERNGLAMSSRNEKLSLADREVAAKVFSRNLSGSMSCDEIKSIVEEHGLEVDYIEEHFGRRFGAVKVKNVRLIDNVEIQ